MRDPFRERTSRYFVERLFSFARSKILRASDRSNHPATSAPILANAPGFSRPPRPKRSSWCARPSAHPSTSAKPCAPYAFWRESPRPRPRAARRAGVTQGALAKWEAGTFRPNDGTLARLLLVLRTSPEDAAWVRRLAREEPFDLQDPDRARAWLAANSPEYNAPNVAALLAFERAVWGRATRDARWEPLLVETMEWRAMAHSYLGEADAPLEAARGALTIARRHDAWDEAAVAVMTHEWIQGRTPGPKVADRVWTAYVERLRTPWSRHSILFDQANMIAPYDPDRAEEIARTIIEEAPQASLSRATDGVTKDNGRFTLALIHQIHGEWEATFETTRAIGGCATLWLGSIPKRCPSTFRRRNGSVRPRFPVWRIGSPGSIERRGRGRCVSRRSAVPFSTTVRDA